MKLNAHQFSHASTRLFAAAALVTSLAFAPGLAFAVGHVGHEERAELRIKDMHNKLKITQDQEEQWSKVAQVMRDSAKTMDTLSQARADKSRETSAIDDLKSYGEITAAHADGIKKLTPVFSTLYSSMSDLQKKEADTLFRRGDRRHGHKMMKAK